MPYKFLVSFILLFFLQPNVQDKSRYSTAFEYLKKNGELQNEILRNLRSDQYKSGIPTLSDSIIYSGMFAFSIIPDSSKIILNKEDRNYSNFNKKYFFKTYIDSNLMEIESPSESGFVLYFSKPINNFLLASIYLKSGFRSPFRIYYGDAVMILFVFDENNSVIEAHIQGFILG